MYYTIPGRQRDISQTGEKVCATRYKVIKETYLRQEKRYVLHDTRSSRRHISGRRKGMCYTIPGRQRDISQAGEKMCATQYQVIKETSQAREKVCATRCQVIKETYLRQEKRYVLHDTRSPKRHISDRRKGMYYKIPGHQRHISQTLEKVRLFVLCDTLNILCITRRI